MEYHFDGGVQVPSANRVKQHGVFRVGPLPNTGQTFQFCTDSHYRGILKRADQRGETRVVGGFIDAHVEFAVELGPSGRPRSGAHRFMKFLGPGDDLVGELRDSELEHERLESLHDLVDLAEVVLVEFGDDSASVGIDDDQPLRSEISQGFSDRSGAHLEKLGDVVLDKAGSARELTVEDRGAHALANVNVSSLSPPSGDRICAVVLENLTLKNFEWVNHKPTISPKV